MKSECVAVLDAVVAFGADGVALGIVARGGVALVTAEVVSEEVVAQMLRVPSLGITVEEDPAPAEAAADEPAEDPAPAEPVAEEPPVAETPHRRKRHLPQA
jgi:hypothetical protein